MVDDFLSQLEGMLLEGSYTAKTTTSTGKEGELGLKLPSIIQGSAKVNGSSLSEVEQKILETPVVKFSRLYDLLKEQGMIQTLNGFDKGIYDQIQNGEVVEVKGEARLPQWEDLTKSFSEISDLAEVMKALGQDPWSDPAARQAFEGFTSLATKKKQEDVWVIISPFGSPQFKFVAKLDLAKLKRRKEELKAEVTIICKVYRKLAERETIDIFRLVPELSSLEKLNRVQRRQAGQHRSGKISTDSPLDEAIKYPAMKVWPIALFQ